MGSACTTEPVKVCLCHNYLQSTLNRPFPSSLVPLFQNESKCETILMKTNWICMKMNLQADLISIRMVSHLDLFSNRGTRELGNGVFFDMNRLNKEETGEKSKKS